MATSEFTTVDRLMREGIEENVFPGAVLLVAREGGLLFHEAYGKADIYSGGEVTVDTLFDLASLTKPLVTALCAMALVESGRLGLDDPLGDRLAVFAGTDKADITAAHLLRHTSGLPDYRPYYEALVRRPEGARAAHLLKLLAAEERITAAGVKTRYSDLGFLLLQRLIEKTAGVGLDALARQWIFEPLAIESLHFPKMAPPFPLARYASTEKCPWRKRVLRGEVHDDNAWVLGGVAGHAGLFGTARDVWRLAQYLLDVWRGDAGKGPFTEERVRMFLARRTPRERALGFDVPDPVSPSCGGRFGVASVGHLGFTGTSFWMDPESTLVVVLLSNRVHPSRENQKIRSFRPQIHDAAALAAMT